MEFTDGEVHFDRPPSDLDRLVLDVVAVLEELGIDYAVVSGYVAVLFGRARATEDVGVVAERFDETTAEALADRLAEVGFWESATPLSELYATLADDLPVRIAEEDHRVPNVELKFATDEFDRTSLRNTVTVHLGDETHRLAGAADRLQALDGDAQGRRRRRTSTRSRGQCSTGTNSKGTSSAWASRESTSD